MYLDLSHDVHNDSDSNLCIYNYFCVNREILVRWIKICCFGFANRLGRL